MQPTRHRLVKPRMLTLSHRQRLQATPTLAIQKHTPRPREMLRITLSQLPLIRPQHSRLPLPLPLLEPLPRQHFLNHLPLLLPDKYPVVTTHPPTPRQVTPPQPHLQRPPVHRHLPHHLPQFPLHSRKRRQTPHLPIQSLPANPVQTKTTPSPTTHHSPNAASKISATTKFASGDDNASTGHSPRTTSRKYTH